MKLHRGTCMVMLSLFHLFVSWGFVGVFFCFHESLLSVTLWVCVFFYKLILNLFFLLWERRKCQQLELISKQFEKVRQKFQKEIEGLRTKLLKADDENSALRTSMAQRTSQFQIIQEDLLKRASKTSSLEREVSF